MSLPVISIPGAQLRKLGIKRDCNINYQLSPEELVQDALRLGEGVLNNTGALVILTGKFTGRSPKDRFIVKDEITADSVNWNDFNQPLEEKYFQAFYDKIIDHFNQLPSLWVRDCYACADPRYRLNIRCINEKPANNLFAYNMFLRPNEEDLDDFEPDWHILSAPSLVLNPKECGLRQLNGAVISFKHKMILKIGRAHV